MTETLFLDRPDGRIAYDLIGDAGGPLVICAPGLGDLRSTFRTLAPRLAEAGYRVATMDVRGAGETSVAWPGYRPADIADDLLALVHELGGGRSAVLVGNSYGGSAAVLAAAREPDAVAGLVLSGAFVRDIPANLVGKIATRLALLPWIGSRLWPAVFWPSFFRIKPADMKARRAELAANLAEPGRHDALRTLVRTGSHAPTDEALPSVRCPALVVMGSKDPDFPDQQAEARRTADRLGGPATVLMVDGAGHYPHLEATDVVAPAMIDFLRTTVWPARA